MSVQDRTTTRDAHERALFDAAMSPPAATSGPRSDDSPPGAPLALDPSGALYDALASRCNDLQHDYRLVADQEIAATESLKASVHPAVWSAIAELLEGRDRLAQA